MHTKKIVKIVQKTLNLCLATALVLTMNLTLSSLINTQVKFLPAEQVAAQSTQWQRENFDDALKFTVAELLFAEVKNMPELTAQKLKEVETKDAKLAEILDKIVKYWRHVEKDMSLKFDSKTEMPDPAHHAFIVLGYALAKDGTMKPELIGRLEAALAAHKDYPQAYFYVTGGVPQNGHTEGELMRAWLIEHGVPEKQVFAETLAPDTAGNAANTFKMIYDNTELNIKTVSVISSAYHVKRGSVLLYAESLLKAAEMNKAVVEFKEEFNRAWERQDLKDETSGHRAYTLSQILHCNKEFKFLQDADSAKPEATESSLALDGAKFSTEAVDKQAATNTTVKAQVAKTGEEAAASNSIAWGLLLLPIIIAVYTRKQKAEN